MSENSDFHSYDTEVFNKNQASSSLNTDDRFAVVYGDLIFRYQYLSNKTNFYLDISKQAYWGSGNFQGTDQGLNPILINRLYFTLTPIESFTFTFGRHRYTLGDAVIDTVFSTIIDGMQIQYKPSNWFHLILMGDVMSVASQVEYAGIYSIIKKDTEVISNFKGDSISVRGGAVFNFSILSALNLKTFGYYLRYGANNLGGADRAQSGKK